LAGSAIGWSRVRLVPATIATRADATAVAGILTGLGALLVIRTTLLPTVGSWDTGEAQVVPPILGTMHPTGFPAYVVLGWLANLVLTPFGTPAYRMNLLSAILVAVAVAGTVAVARRLGAQLPIAVATGIGFALTPVVWSIGTAADVHALHLALVVGVVLLLLRWDAFVAARDEHPRDVALARRADRAIVLAAALFGVAVANHALALLLVPAIGLYVLATDPGILFRPRTVLGALGACLGVAVLLYLELPLRGGLLRAPLVYAHPETWGGFWEIVLARQFQGDVLNPLADLPATVGSLLDLLGQQYGLLLALVPAGLCVTAARFPRYALLSGVGVAITVFFAISYSNAQIERYYLGPVFFAWTWIGVLAATVVDAIAARLAAPAEDPADGPAADRDLPDGPARRSVPGGTLTTAISVMLGLALLVPTAGALPVRWQQNDRSQETWVDAWLDQALAAMAPNAVVVSWWSYSTPLWYAQLIDGRRPDVTVIDDRTRLDLGLGEVDQTIDHFLAEGRPVYLMRVSMGEIMDLASRFTIEPVGLPGNLYHVTGRQEAAVP
jgi:hypothetical protein